MKNTSWTDQLRYRFDNFMSKGTIALIGGLGVLSLVIIIIGSLVLVATGIRPEGADQPLSFHEAAWESMMRTLDAGTMGGDAGWGYRLVMFGVTLGGVFVISTLIGVLTSGIEGKMDELRKGRSRVIEENHTVILGWSPQIFTVISELIAANANQRHSCIVIMGDKDKVEMEEEILANVGDSGRTRVVCRTGSPVDLNDLEMVSLYASKSIILLSPSKDYPDAEVIKTILAITNNPRLRNGRADKPFSPCRRDPRSKELAGGANGR